MENSHLEPLCQETANAIALWEYGPPYDAYNFKGTPNDYLFDTATWGDEQFCLMCSGEILGQVACQYEGTDLWVGWSMVPKLCGQGYGAAFVQRCVTELCRVKNHHGRMAECCFVYPHAITEPSEPMKKPDFNIWKRFRTKLLTPG